MKVDSKLISKLENLSKLYLSEIEKEQLKGDLTKILTMIDQIKDVDVEGVEPLRHMSEVSNRGRQDIPQKSLDLKTAMDNAPKKKNPFFVVPNVLATGKKRASK